MSENKRFPLEKILPATTNGYPYFPELEDCNPVAIHIQGICISRSSLNDIVNNFALKTPWNATKVLDYNVAVAPAGVYNGNLMIFYVASGTAYVPRTTETKE